MYNVIIADDEEVVRNGLKKHFHWYQYDMEVIADFPDGEKAWQYILHHPVDLVVTDVRMPNLDGISLARQIHDRFPSIQIIFISGYDDTDYLRKAFKTEAVDYILKSIDLDEFAQTIDHVRQRMERETHRQRALEELGSKLEQSIPLLQQKWLMQLVSSEVEPGSIVQERLQFLNIPLYEDIHYCVLVVQVQELWRRFMRMSERQRQLFSLRFVNRARVVLNRFGSDIVFENRLGEYVVILNTEQNDYEDTLLKVSQELQQIVEGDLEAKCSIGIGERFIGFSRIHAGYTSAVNAITGHYYVGENQAISVDKFGGQSANYVRERAEKTISNVLISRNPAGVGDALATVFADMDAMETLQEQQNFMIFLLFLPLRVLSDLPVQQMGPYSDQFKLVERFLCCADTRERRLFLRQQYEAVMSLVDNHSDSQSNHIVEKTRSIIESNYMNQISIATLAEQVFVTPTYLCMLFKQATGQTINEYITQIRIRRAKQLLADSRIKLYDVCCQVGYLSPSYFSSIFKKYTHMTPREYREAVTKAN